MVSSVLSAGLTTVYQQLTAFAGLESFWTSFDTVFGTEYNLAVAQSFRAQWQSGNFSQLPTIEVIDDQILGNARGAYASSSNTIFLSDTFLETASQQSLEAVILEEFGHFVDAQVNQTDTAGDEGELFSAIVRSVNLSAAELSRIKTEDDHAVVMIDGQAMAIEKSESIYFDDFETAVGNAWSSTNTDITPIANRKFLGQFGNDTVSLTLTDPRFVNNNITLEFDLFIIQSWDGNNPIFGPDKFDLSITGGQTLLNTTFSNVPSDDFPQAYPGNFGSGNYPFQTGAIEVNTLGYSFYGDSVYHLSYTFLSTSNSITFNFSGIGLEEIDSESWGLDNVSVGVTLPSITLAVAPASVLEDGTTNLVYTFTRTGATTNALTVNYTIAGTATNGTDYATIGTSVTFAANSATATLTIDPTADTTIEANDTVALTLATGTGYVIGTTDAVTGTITNDDLPSITLAVAPTSVTEDGTTNLVYTFTRTGPTTSALTVNYSIAGTADATDYTGATPGTGKTITFAANSATATLTIDPTADTTIEANDTVALTLATGTGYVIGTTAAVTGTITNDDLPSITLAVAPTSVTEDGTTNLVYTFTRTGATTSALTVNYSIAGTANATDYTGATPGTGKTITFAAGSATTILTIDPTADTTIESNETIALTLATGTGYAIGTTTAVTGTITNDDLPSITLAVAPASVTEDGTTNLVYTFTRTGPTTSTLTANYGITGTADATDYTGATPGTGKTITFAANSATATLTIDPTADTTIEANDTVALTLATGTGYTIGTTTAVTGTITDDDTPSISLALNYGGISENSPSNFIYTFTRTGSTTNALTVNYGITGTTDATDYTGATPGAGKTIVFSAGAATATLALDSIGDTSVETDETISLQLATGTGYTVGTSAAQIATIINDDGTRRQKGTNGKDVILGTNLGDILSGGLGNDTLAGSDGGDSFLFNATNEGIDTITDFSVGSDYLLIKGSAFGGGLVSGDTITSAQFIIGTAATNASQRFIYNATNGALFFDVDGNGATSAIQFATLSPKLGLTFEDIFIS
jgi:Ca2+-binding RTX toxin-like protein